MSPATWPRAQADEERLLVMDRETKRFADATVGDLPRQLRRGDLLIVNDAATFPGSLRAGAIEIRLVGERSESVFTAVLFGEGDWRTPTEKRPSPPRFAVGDRVAVSADLAATVVHVSPHSPRLVELRFDRSGAALWSALYASARPIQYSYVREPLELWHVQTRYASRPWAAELPSAGRPLRWSTITELVRSGVRFASVTHAAGISSTGDADLDAMLPLPERYEIPRKTVETIAHVKASGGRIIAVGTSVVRALEGCAASHGGELVSGIGITDLRIGPDHERRIVDGLFTGMHEPTASHSELLRAFAPADFIARAYAHAEAAGYLGHEFGDSNLIV